MVHSSLKIIFLVVLLFCTATMANEESSKDVTSNATIIKKKISQKNTWAVGLSYTHWNESTIVSQGNNLEKSFSSYSGPGITGGYSYNTNSWSFGLKFDFATGRASLGNLNNIVFLDASDRLWYALISQTYLLFKAHRYWAIGLGYSARLRYVSWEPSDQTIKIKIADPLMYAPLLHLRWTLSKKIQLLHSYAYFGNKQSQWNISAVYTF